MKKIIALLCIMANPLSAGELSLDDLSGYLNDLSTAKGAFTQVNADGSIATGAMYLRRPGRMRFDYNPPERSMVIVGGGQVAVFDPKSDEPTRFPLNQTPLKLILEREVDLAKRDMVVGHSSDGTRTTLTLQDPDHPDYGSIQMVFTDDPIQLRQWIVDDNSGNPTTVILGDWSEGIELRGRLFNIQAEMARWGQ